MLCYVLIRNALLNWLGEIKSFLDYFAAEFFGRNIDEVWDDADSQNDESQNKESYENRRLDGVVEAALEHFALFIFIYTWCWWLEVQKKNRFFQKKIQFLAVKNVSEVDLVLEWIRIFSCQFCFV